MEVGTSDDGLLNLWKYVIFPLLPWKKRLSHSISPLCLLGWKIYRTIAEVASGKGRRRNGRDCKGKALPLPEVSSFCCPAERRVGCPATHFNWSLFLNRLSIRLSIMTLLVSLISWSVLSLVACKPYTVQVHWTHQLYILASDRDSHWGQKDSKQL